MLEQRSLNSSAHPNHQYFNPNMKMQVLLQQVWRGGASRHFISDKLPGNTDAAGPLTLSSKVFEDIGTEAVVYQCGEWDGEEMAAPLCQPQEPTGG